MYSFIKREGQNHQYRKKLFTQYYFSHKQTQSRFQRTHKTQLREKKRTDHHPLNPIANRKTHNRAKGKVNSDLNKKGIFLLYSKYESLVFYYKHNTPYYGRTVHLSLCVLFCKKNGAVLPTFELLIYLLLYCDKCEVII